MNRFSLSFNNNLGWHTLIAMPPTLPPDTYDMESVATHEIGHAHLLKHSNNHNDLMYFTDLTPPYSRNIGSFDLAGGLWEIKNGIEVVNTGGNNCKPQMIKINPADCMVVTEIIEFQGSALNISIFPTLFEDKVLIKIDNNTTVLNFQILNTLGQVVKTGIIDSEIEQIDLGHPFPAGIYYVNIRTQQQNLITKKIVKK
jgi:hypothetical protein